MENRTCKILKTMSSLIVLHLLIINCYHVRVYFKPPVPNNKPVVKEIQYWFWGLRPSPVVIQATDFCPDGNIASLYEYSSGKDFFLENITLGIYAPKHLEAECFETQAPSRKRR